jgi:hypothetical protein
MCCEKMTSERGACGQYLDDDHGALLSWRSFGPQGERR